MKGVFPDFAYAQARVQAHHGGRLTDADWSRLRASRDLAHFLESARRTSVGPWLSYVDPTSDTHAIERAMRRTMREHVEEVAAWVPARWREAVLWTRALVDLPALAWLGAGQQAPDWMRADPAMAPRVDVDPDGPGEGSATASPETDAEAGRDVWVEGFFDRLPALPLSARAEVRALTNRLEEHLSAMREAPATTDGWALRESLASHLARVVHRQAVRPVAVFAHLGLVALDLERLRGALVRRVLFPHLAADVAWV